MCKYCSIIPQIVLNELEKEHKIKPSIRNTKSFESFRNKRNKALLLKSDNNLIINGIANRKIYDSKKLMQQQVNLVRFEGEPPTHDQDVNTVYDNALIIKNYFEKELGWFSIDNNGMDLIFNIHYGKKYNNAFWDGDDMTFGDGDGSLFIGFSRALDVTAHELTHGIVQFTAKLNYIGQSGALNEHFADVFGTVIKQYYNNENENTADWLMGDKIMGPKLKGKAIRSMKEPNNAKIVLQAQPIHMNEYYNGADDNYGVHINSGIVNKVFYLVSKEIGTFKAAKLWFSCLTNGLQPNSQFIDLYNTLVANIPNLVLQNIIPNTTLNIVNKAFKNVGII